MLITQEIAATAVSFDEPKIRGLLQIELVKVVKDNLVLQGEAVPTSISELSSRPTELDSIVVVTILPILDDILGFKLKDSVVNYGGYESVDQALGLLMPKIEKAWKKAKKDAEQ